MTYCNKVGYVYVDFSDMMYYDVLNILGSNIGGEYIFRRVMFFLFLFSRFFYPFSGVGKEGRKKE